MEVKIGTAEKKILVTLCYYTLLQFTIPTLTLLFGYKIEQFTTELHDYFKCASMNGECSQPQLHQTFSPVGLVLNWLFPACVPLFLLVYVIDCQRFKNSVKKRSVDLFTC